MKAELTLVNPNRGMIAARSEDGEFVILEILGECNIEIGDIVSHKDFHSMVRKNIIINPRVNTSLYLFKIYAVA